jgi:hypothetical protein
MSEAISHHDILGNLVTSLVDRREQIRKLEAQLKELKAAQRENELEVMDTLDALGVEGAKTEFATVSISSEEQPTVDPEHWPDVWEYLFNNGYTELLRRQINALPWRALKDLGVEIPHVTPFTQRKLNIRAR